MAVGVARPKSLDERYEALAPESEWLCQFLAWRDLGIQPEDWLNATPWWKKRLALDGWRATGILESEERAVVTPEQLGLTVKTVEAG